MMRSEHQLQLIGLIICCSVGGISSFVQRIDTSRLQWSIPPQHQQQQNVARNNQSNALNATRPVVGFVNRNSWTHTLAGNQQWNQTNKNHNNIGSKTSSSGTNRWNQSRPNTPNAGQNDNQSNRTFAGHSRGGTTIKGNQNVLGWAGNTQWNQIGNKLINPSAPAGGGWSTHNSGQLNLHQSSWKNQTLTGWSQQNKTAATLRQAPVVPQTAFSGGWTVAKKDSSYQRPIGN